MGWGQTVHHILGFLGKTLAQLLTVNTGPASLTGELSFFFGVFVILAQLLSFSMAQAHVLAVPLSLHLFC